MAIDGPDSSWKLEFENGQVASGLTAPRNPDVLGCLARLGLERRRPVVVVLGGAASLSGPKWDDVSGAVGAALVRAAERSGAAIVDGGTAAGVMTAVGAAAAERTRSYDPTDGPGPVTLLGVAPAGLVAHPAHPGAATTNDLQPLEPHHSHFLLASSAEWGGETELLFAAAEALAGDCQVVAVVAGGGDITLDEAREAARRSWPTFLLRTTGGTAEAIIERISSPPRSGIRARAELTDARLREIVRTGDLRLADPAASDDLARRLAWELQEAPTLKAAWERFARYDALAKRHRRTFERIQAGVLILGIAATLIALVQRSATSWTSSRAWIDTTMHWLVVAIPITVSMLIAFVGRLHGGKRWVLLRGAAEAIKAEIYQYRTWAGPYRARDSRAEWPPRADALLAERLAAVDAMLVQTEMSTAALPAYDGVLPPLMFGASAVDDGLSHLDGDGYLQVRVADQLNFYRRKSASLERRLRWLQVLTIAAGGVGTFLAALGLEIWVGLTTAIAGATLAHLGYLQVEATLVAYNRAAARLEGLQTQWRAREQHDRGAARLPALVEEAESVLHIEHGVWAQQMSEAVEKATAAPGARKHDPRPTEPGSGNAELR